MASAATAKKAGLAMFLLASSQFIITVDYNIVYVALPDIGTALGFSEQYLQWVVSAYAVSFGGLLLFGGRAVDRIGARRILMVGLTCYGVASLAGGFAPDQTILIGARLVQGIGGALLFPSVLALIATSFRECRERTRAFAMWAMTGSLGLAAGALLGGVLTDLASWRWVFLINIPGSVLWGTGTYLDAAKAAVASGLRLAGIIGGAMLIVSGFLALDVKKQRAPGGTAETIEAGEQEVPARALS